MQYTILEITRDLVEQGLGEESFDALVGANVIGTKSEMATLLNPQGKITTCDAQDRRDCKLCESFSVQTVDCSSKNCVQVGDGCRFISEYD